MASSHKPSRRRMNGEGSIYQVPGENRWRGALSYEDPDTGATRRRVVSARSAAEVREKLTNLRRDLDRGLAPTAGAVTVEAHLTRWLEAARPRMRPATWRSHEQYVRLHLVSAIGKVPIVRLTPSDVERMTSRLIESGRSATTARSARTTLRLALADAMRDGLVARNVAALARPPRTTRPTMAALTAQEATALIEGTVDDELGPLFAVAVTTGLRQGELLGLSWKDVDLEGRVLVVRHSMARDWSGGWSLAEPKTARSRRTIMLPGAAIAALRRQRARQATARLAAGSAWQDGDDLVFTDAVGQPLRGYNVTHDFAATLRRLAIRHVRFHDLRHTAATLLLATGTPLKVVSDLLGHSTIAITADTYAHVTPELRREAASAMDRALGGAG